MRKRILISDDISFLGRELERALSENPAYELLSINDENLKNPDIMLCNEEHPFSAEEWAKTPSVCMGAAMRDLHWLTSMWDEARPRRIIMLGRVGQYPETVGAPLHPELLWDGFPASGRRGFMQNVRMEHAFAYGESHPGVIVQHVIVDGLYGPGDDIRADAEVIPALIYKFVQAVLTGADTVTVYGSAAGAKATKRNFLHIEDAIAGMLLILEKAPDSGIINLGNPVGTTVANLTKIISSFTGFTGKILYDATHPDGRPDRTLDTAYMQSLGFTPDRRLISSLGEIIKDYQQQAVAAVTPSA